MVPYYSITVKPREAYSSKLPQSIDYSIIETASRSMIMANGLNIPKKVIPYCIPETD